MTATSAASLGSPAPAPTTCATSCKVPPAMSPCTKGFSTPESAHGYTSIPNVPKSTTVATAATTFSLWLRVTDCTANTAAAPQMALPAPMSKALCLSKPIFCPKNHPRLRVLVTTKRANPAPAKPTCHTWSRLMRSPYSTMPRRNNSLVPSFSAPLCPNHVPRRGNSALVAIPPRTAVMSGLMG